MNITETKIDLFCNGLRVNKNIDFNIAKEIVPSEEYIGHGTKRASLSDGKCMVLHHIEDTITNVAVLESFAKRSPYEFKLIYGKGWIYNNGNRVVNSDPVSTPIWYSDPEILKIFQLHGNDCLATAISNYCVYKEKDDGCKFCALDSGGKYVIKTSDEIKNALQRIEQEKELRAYQKIDGKSDYVDIKDININSGTIPGAKGIELHHKIIKAIRDVSDIPISLQVCPLERTEIENLHSEGVDTISFNIEIYNEKSRKRIIPGKSKDYTITKYVKSLKDAVDVFGDNQVSSWLIGGLEDPEDTIKGCKIISDVGAIPHIAIHRPLIGTPLGERSPPKKEDIMKIYRNLLDILIEYGIDPLKHKAGCIRCGGCSATLDAIKYGV